MSARRALLGAALVVAAVVAQAVVVPRLPLPGGGPDLVLLLVVVLGLVRGPAEGMTAGFGAGLLVDALAGTALGTAALVLCVTGFLAGALGDPRRSLPATLALVAGLSALAGTGLAAVLVLSGQPHAGLADLLARALATAAYGAAVAPLALAALGPGARAERAERVR